MARRNWLGEKPLARKRADRLTRKVAMRSSAVFFDSSSIICWSSRISRLITRINWRRSCGSRIDSSSSRSKGIRQTDQFAGQVEPGDMFFATVAQAEGLQRAGTYGEHRVEDIALAKQEFAFFQGTTALDDLVQRVHVFHIQRKRQAQGRQTAILAMSLMWRMQLDASGHRRRFLGKTRNARKVTAGWRSQPVEESLNWLAERGFTVPTNDRWLCV